MKNLLLLLIPFLIWSEEKPIVVIVPSYNNAKWCDYNLTSILKQNYQNFRIIYIDDASSDGTADLVEQYKDNRILLIRNQERKGALANIYHAVHSCKDDEIIALVDGDDWLLHHNVLSILNNTYASPNVWFTHGSYIEYPFGRIGLTDPIPKQCIHDHSFRTHKKVPTHLRTFYAWLFKKIALEDLLFEGAFFPMSWDLAIMWPLCEMAGDRHAFIFQPLYVYNMRTSLNDHKVNAALQKKLGLFLRTQKPYPRLP